jgi:hypothetical protein
MLNRNPGRNTSSSIAPVGAVTLTYKGCICRERAAWDEQHCVFFADNELFFQSTIFQPEAYSRSGTGATNALKDRSSWILEDDKANMFGRIQIQIMTGHFRQGFLLVDIEDSTTIADYCEILGQLIASLFVSMRLDTLKLIPASPPAILAMGVLCDTPPTEIKSFALGWFQEMTSQKVYHLEHTEWMASSAGIKAMSNLGWLKNRMAREEAAAISAGQEKKKSWLFTLLTLGRGRRRNEKMIHPLDQIRNKFID